MLHQNRRDELLVFVTPQIVAGYGVELPTASQLWENRKGSWQQGLAASN
jgi:hypothetical protein